MQRYVARVSGPLLDRIDIHLEVPAVPYRELADRAGGAPRRDLGRLRRLLSALPLWLPTSATWRRIDGWLSRAVPAGERFGVGDLLIGAIAADHDASLWSLDRDFRRMERLRFVRLHPGR